MADLEELSIFESVERHRDYIPRSKLEKFKIFCKLWGVVIFVIVCGTILIGITIETRGELNQYHKSTNDLKNELQVLNEKFTTLNESQNELEFYRKAASARNCKELYNHGFKDSGVYRIDPDKRYLGQTSFLAYCDSETKETRIKPTENEIIFSNFSSAQALPVKYGPTTNQIESLIAHSGSCYQTIDMTCTHVPISAGTLWWIDKWGKHFYFTKIL